jgi:Inner membrane protein YgaP-like, transmembrane domain
MGRETIMKVEEVEKASAGAGPAAPDTQHAESRARMTVDRYLRIIAGAFVLLSLALGYWVSPYWYVFTAFVGLNFFQSGFTNRCPMMSILRKTGLED